MKQAFQIIFFITALSANVSAHFTCDNTLSSYTSSPNAFSQAMNDENEIPVLYETQVLTQAVDGPDTKFGNGIALEGETLVIGKRAPWQEGFDSVEIYELQNNLWSFVKLLQPPDQQLSDLFTRPALYGDTLLVGSGFYCATGSECKSGTAYIFERNQGGEGNWGFVQQLDGGNRAGAWFGIETALYKDIAVVAAHNENIGSSGQAGAVYIFERDHGGPNHWGMVKRLESDSQQKLEGDFFGSEISIINDTVMIIGDDGAVIYEFGRNEGGVKNWGLVQKLTNPIGQAHYHAFDGTTLVLRGRNPCIPSEDRTNYLLFYERNSKGIWTKQQEIDTGLDVKYLALDGNQLIAKSKDFTVAYLYQRGSSADTWKMKAMLPSRDEYTPLRYSYDVVLNAGRAVLGFTPANDNKGVAFFYNTTETINAGHAGAWFNPETSGQGQFIDVEPEKQLIFLSWFTFTDNDSDHPFEQQWFTAQGSYNGNTAVLDLFETTGGKFDDPQEITTTQIGEVTLSFSDCSQGQMSYSFDEEELQGTFPMLRVIGGSDNVCKQLSGNTTQAVDINAGTDGAWFDPSTSGQGYFIDAHPDPEGGNIIFVSWFTYGDATASGQRWLTAQGSFVGSTAEIDVFETTGGSFDGPEPASTTKVGTMSLDFTDCSNAQLSYSLPADPAEGDIAITRVIPGSQALCDELAGAD